MLIFNAYFFENQKNLVSKNIWICVDKAMTLSLLEVAKTYKIY